MNLLMVIVIGSILGGLLVSVADRIEETFNN